MSSGITGRPMVEDARCFAVALGGLPVDDEDDAEPEEEAIVVNNNDLGLSGVQSSPRREKEEVV